MELAQRSLGEQSLRFSKNDLSGFHHIFLLFDRRKSCAFQSLRFSKNDLSGFHHIFSFLTGENLVLFRYSYYLCPNIINFDSVDISEHRPEEVMFLLTLSVVKPPNSLCFPSQWRIQRGA